MISPVAALRLDAPALSKAVQPAWMLVGTGETVEKL